MAALGDPCRFCGTPATVVALLGRGCACFPDDRVQALCEQHWCNLEPIGRADVILDAYAVAK